MSTTAKRLHRMSDKTRRLIQSADSRLNKKLGYESNPISSIIEVLEISGRVEVGFRESCGGTDFTMFVQREWIRVVKSLANDGHFLREEAITHGNSWATKSGGFWRSVIYCACNVAVSFPPPAPHQRT